MKHTRIMIPLLLVALMAGACGNDSESSTTTTAGEESELGDAPQGRLLVEDSFDNDDFGWIDTVFEDEMEFAAVEDGALVFTSSPDRIILPTAYPGTAQNDDLVSDQRIETTVLIESPGVAVIECRRAWDSDDPSRVQFYVSASGTAGLDRIITDGFNAEGQIDRDKFVELDKVDHGTLEVADGETHELALECVGGADGGAMKVTGFVDGEAVVSGETDDPTPIGHASLGLDFSGTAADDADITEVEPFSVSYTDYAFYDLAADAGADLPGTTVVSEEFLDDSRMWLAGRSEDLEDAVTIDNGVLTFDMPADGSSEFLTPYGPRLNDVRGDQRVEATVTIGAGAVAQLACRVSPDEDDVSDVRFSITDAGAALLYRVPEDGVTDGLLVRDKLIELGSADDGTVVVDPGESIDLALECVGGTDGGDMTVTGFVDGEEVVTGVDDDPIPEGWSAVAVDNIDGHNGEDDAGAAAYEVTVERFALYDLSATE